MFEAKLKPRLEIILSAIANKMVALGITANMITLLGFFVNLIATFYFATGHLITGGILILFGGSFDMIDGAVARAQRNLRASGAPLGFCHRSLLRRFPLSRSTHLFLQFGESAGDSFSVWGMVRFNTRQLCQSKSGGTPNYL